MDRAAAVLQLLISKKSSYFFKPYIYSSGKIHQTLVELRVMEFECIKAQIFRDRGQVIDEAMHSTLPLKSCTVDSSFLCKLKWG